jgi:EAL domain-containing protein (putative c-di-GMP-specific phosphodiesterase class I)
MCDLNGEAQGARYLEFELTETALMQDPQSTIAVLRALKDMGKSLYLAAW